MSPRHERCLILALYVLAKKGAQDALPKNFSDKVAELLGQAISSLSGGAGRPNLTHGLPKPFKRLSLFLAFFFCERGRAAELAQVLHVNRRRVLWTTSWPTSSPSAARDRRA